MIPFFYATNLTQQTVDNTTSPWDFVSTAIITDEIRHDKLARQAFYQNPNTLHYFYTGIEGVAGNRRVNKTVNPPKFLHSLSADLDIVIPLDRLATIVESMRLKPSWIEKSLGGKARLVWIFPKPIPLESYDFAVYVLQQALAWLKISSIPGLDEPAFTDPSRLLANGGEWLNTGHPNIPAEELQAFFVACGSSFAFKDCNATSIPLEEVEKAVREKYPNLVWPAAFELETQGPSFWLPNSTSGQSAILKRDGMFTFSGSAEKPFYTWADILGLDFVKKFAVTSIAKATEDVYWDGKQYFRKIQGIYVGIDPVEMTRWFETACGLSTRSEKGCVSGVKKAMAHIDEHNRVVGAAPFVGMAPGKIMYENKAVLNTYVHNIVLPADELTPWGPEGRFPLISAYLDNLFDPHSQLIHFLLWYKRFYVSMWKLTPCPGQCVFLMGPPGIGKTFCSKRIVGDSVGGGMDASDFLTRSQAFNVHAFYKALWQIDDEGMSESAATQAFFQAALKKATANQEFLSHAKFATPTSTTWMGRVMVTANMDYVSSRCLGGLDNSALDKTNLYRCASAENSSFVFPERAACEAQIKLELPYFLRHLVELAVPAHIELNVRYGFKSFQHESLMDKAHQGSKAAPFMELLIEELNNFFKDHPNATEWRGSTTNILKLLSTNPHNDFIMRSLRLESTNRYLELIERGNLIPCRAETGAMKSRTWIFSRPGSIVTGLNLPAPTGQNPFEKIT